jgi:hypothetical protein
MESNYFQIKTKSTCLNWLHLFWLNTLHAPVRAYLRYSNYNVLQKQLRRTHTVYKNLLRINTTKTRLRPQILTTMPTSTLAHHDTYIQLIELVASYETHFNKHMGDTEEVSVKNKHNVDYG